MSDERWRALHVAAVVLFAAWVLACLSPFLRACVDMVAATGPVGEDLAWLVDGGTEPDF